MAWFARREPCAQGFDSEASTVVSRRLRARHGCMTVEVEGNPQIFAKSHATSNGHLHDKAGLILELESRHICRFSTTQAQAACFVSVVSLSPT